MICSKEDLKIYLAQDMNMYKSLGKYNHIMYRIVKDPFYYINKYIVYLRKEELYYNTQNKRKINKIKFIYYLRKKNSLGLKLGFKIPRNCFGPGLEIFHHGEIIVNENARIGENCKLHGGNCIGNKGYFDENPIIGDNLDLGVGAKVIGNVELGNNITVGANAVVTKSFSGDGLVLIGVPAQSIHK